MRKQNVSIGLFILLFSFTTVMAGENVKGQVRQLLQTETLKRADAALESVPMPVPKEAQEVFTTSIPKVTTGGRIRKTRPVRLSAVTEKPIRIISPPTVMP